MDISRLLPISNPLPVIAGVGSALWSFRTPLLVFLTFLRDQFLAHRVFTEARHIVGDSGDPYYAVIRWLAKCYLVLFQLRCTVKGAVVLPAGPRILVANHPNATDAFFLPCFLPERLYVLAQGNLFDLPILGWLLARAGQIPVGPERRALAFNQACELLRQGRTVVIFPEGRLNPAQSPIQAGTGAVRMSLATGAPIIPIGIHVAEKDALRLIHRSKTGVHTGRWQVRGCCSFLFGEMWDPSREVVPGKDKQLARNLTVILMEKIYTLAQAAGKDSDSLTCATGGWSSK